MSEIQYDVTDHVATITLDRPEARNAWSDSMLDEMLERLDEVDTDDRVRALVVTGTDPAFCAGGDLKAMQERRGMFAGDTVELRKKYLRGLQELPRQFNRLEKPVIAAINGAAIGAGLDLALMCDLRVARKGAKFGSTFARVGLIPGDGGAYLLTRIVGLARALDLCLTARIFEADEALSMGLVHRVVEPDELLARAHELADQIASLPAAAVQATKAAIYRTAHQDLESALQITAALQSLVQHTDDHRRAVDAMLEKIG
jgi:enoyl-CoA hydratase/carnithine racemase